MKVKINRILVALASLVFTIPVLTSPVSAALTVPQAVEKGGPAWEGAGCGAVRTNFEEVEGTEIQNQNARIIIGIAKTYNLGQRGALIGLMTGLAESNLTVLSSDAVPISKESPHAQDNKPGDNLSVGLMQQQVTTGWSTFGNGVDNRDVVFQLMDPVYASQAFFGIPEGAILPEGLFNDGSALKKGLQSKDNWDTRDPWVVAQEVQVSAFDGRPREANNFSNVYGGNYKAKQAQAESFMAELWESSPKVALSISVSGGETPPPSTQGCVVSGALRELVASYAWPQYRDPDDDAVYAIQQTEGYQAAVRIACIEGLYVGWQSNGRHCVRGAGGEVVDKSQYTGNDCGAFVTRLMQNSIDPEYNLDAGNTEGQLQYLIDNSSGGASKYQEITSQVHSNPNFRAFGDIAIRNNFFTGHTYMFIGDFPGFTGDIVSASGGWSGPLGDRAPMAGTDSSDDYRWFRFNGVIQ